MSKKYIWLPIFALVLMIGQSSFACPADNKQSASCYCHMSLNNLTKKLDLSNEQTVKIQAIKKQAHNTLKTNIHELKLFRTQINALIIADKMDNTQLDRLITQRIKIKSAMIKSRILMQHQIYTLLTDKQKSQYQDLMKK